MPIDIVKKNKKRRVVNLKKRRIPNKNRQLKKNRSVSGAYSVAVSTKGGGTAASRESLEEKLEKRFANIPDFAKRQKIKMIWITVIFIATIIVISWFYLVSHGVILRIKSKDKGSDFNKLTDKLMNTFKEVKDQFGESNNSILIKANNKLINSLKEKLEKQISKKNAELKDGVAGLTSEFGNLIATYPSPNYYIDNPVKILGRGDINGGEFEIKIRDAENKILGKTDGITQKGGVMSPFEVELNYINPTTETGTLELRALNKRNETDEENLKIANNERDLLFIPVKFIVGLEDWLVYKNTEWGIEFKYPADRFDITPKSDNNSIYLRFNNREKPQNGKIVQDFVFVHYYKNIDKLSNNFDISDKTLNFQNLQSFLNVKWSKKIQNVNINGLDFNYLISSAGKGLYFVENDLGAIFYIESSIQSDVLYQILATFKFIKPNYENWKEYKDIGGEVIFKYPERLEVIEEAGQIVFKTKDPDDLSFYFFAIEPQIDNLKRYVEKSSINLEEKIIKSETKNFGDAVGGIYYQAAGTQNFISDENGDAKKSKSIVYMFNHYGTTYSIRTNKDDFPNTFENILNSIRFKTSYSEIPEDEDLRREFLKKYQR